jgi:hypothetical protein
MFRKYYLTPQSGKRRVLEYVANIPFWYDIYDHRLHVLSRN